MRITFGKGFLTKAPLIRTILRNSFFSWFWGVLRLYMASAYWNVLGQFGPNPANIDLCIFTLIELINLQELLLTGDFSRIDEFESINTAAAETWRNASVVERRIAFYRLSESPYRFVRSAEEQKIILFFQENNLNFDTFSNFIVARNAQIRLYFRMLYGK